MANISIRRAPTEGQASSRSYDVYTLIPFAAFAYILIIAPLLKFSVEVTAESGLSASAAIQNLMTPRPENKIFWPALTLITLIAVARDASRLARLPAHVIFLGAYLAFAGLSILWAFKPELTATRFIMQSMIVTCIIFPIILAGSKTDVLRGIYLCFAITTILNVPIVLNQSPLTFESWQGTQIIGYPGYFSFKGELGECAAIAFLLSLYQILFSGRRRFIGLIVLAASIFLIIASKSKGSLGIALIAPFIAGATLFIGNKLRISPALTIAPIPFAYAAVSLVVGNLINRISWHIFGNYDLSGRVHIWNFVQYEISKKPVLGWGYQSFWLVGSDGPSVLEAPGWIKSMPSGHNGYLDTRLELGYIGLLLLIAFIVTTVHMIGHVARRNSRLALLLLTIAFFVILTNFLESIWMRGQDTLWMMFLVVAAIAARYWPPYNRAFTPDYQVTKSRMRRRPLARKPITTAQR